VVGLDLGGGLFGVPGVEMICLRLLCLGLGVGVEVLGLGLM
jgi:hypothetical protein